MAIVFNKDISETSVLMAYNNNVVEFTSNSSEVILNASIVIDSLPSIILYPNVNGVFFFNFKEYITSIMNVDYFADDMLMEINSTTDFQQFWEKAFLSNIITFRINFIDLSFETTTRELNWLFGLVQLTNKTNPIADINSTSLLFNSPINYWNGYPFDIAFYAVENITLTGESNTYNIVYPSKITRLIISNGTDEIIGMFDKFGYNNFDLNDKDFIINKIQPCDGTYIKWLNKNGCFSYWLFSKSNNKLNTKDLGELNNDFNNILDTTSKTIQLGKQAQNRIEVETDLINVTDKEHLQDLFVSPKIYLFIGQPNQASVLTDWLEISLVTSSFDVEFAKKDLYNYNLTFELPTKDTITQ